jgi:potassium/hydrogen antiporter
MTELQDFGQIVLVVAAGFTLALLSTKLTQFVPVPPPAIFLLAAAVASDVFPRLESVLSIQDVERIAVVALIVILFNGGMDIGWRRFRASAVPIVLLGVPGTFVTAALVGLFAHEALGLGWTTALILGAAVAPTDPAVMFSTLGRRTLRGRSGTILEGESGANDPVGIALMIGMIEFATHDDASAWTVARVFSLELSVGLAVGVAGAALLLPLLRRVSLPAESLYPLRALAAAAVIYGVASVAHGSGFIAVFVAGLLIGDARAPYMEEVERFQSALASVAEMTVFLALGLTIHLRGLGSEGIWGDALVLAFVLTFLARPLVVAALLPFVRLRWGERAFIAWAGLKGAVPILLAAFALLAEVDEADRIYGIVFVVVAFSVLVQGTSVPLAARRLGIALDEEGGETSRARFRGRAPAG